MAMTRDLLTIGVHTDDETGVYSIGEMDYAVPWETRRWLETGDNREKLAEWLEVLAKSCRESRPPFGNNYNYDSDNKQINS